MLPQPGEFERVDVDFVLAEHGLERQPAADRADDGAVFGGDPINVLLDLKSAGAQHVLHDDDGLAGNMFAEVPGQDARVNVVGRAGAAKDQQGQLAALVELLHRLRRGIADAGDNQQSCGHDYSRAPGKSLHDRLPVTARHYSEIPFEAQ